MLEIPSLWAIGAYTTKVSSLILFCLSSLRISRVSILCSLSHNFTIKTPTSSILAKSIFLKVKADLVKLFLDFDEMRLSSLISIILVSPKTSFKTSEPNCSLSSSSVQFVSSITSCNEAAKILLLFSLKNPTSVATKIGCTA